MGSSTLISRKRPLISDIARERSAVSAFRRPWILWRKTYSSIGTALESSSVNSSGWCSRSQSAGSSLKRRTRRSSFIGGRDRRSSHVADPATFPRIFGVDRFPGRRPGLLRGFLPGLIRVKEKVNAVCVAAEGAKVGGGCRRAQGCDGVLYAGLVEHQHIGVALNDEHRAFLAYSLQDLGEAVEQVALVEDLRLGGVQVLGMIVTEGTGSEADDPAAPVGDREGDPASKTLPTPHRKKPRSFENLPLEPQLRRCLDKTRDTTGRSITQTEFFYSRNCDAAALQVVAGVLGSGGLGLQEVLVIVDGSRGQGPMDGTTTEGALLCGLGVAGAFELEFDAGSLGQVRNGVHERERLEIHDEFYGVPAFITTETMVEVPFRVYGEGGGFLRVIRVRAETDEAGPLAPESGELRGHLDDVRRLPHLLYAPL